MRRSASLFPRRAMRPFADRNLWSRRKAKWFAGSAVLATALLSSQVRAQEAGAISAANFAAQIVEAQARAQSCAASASACGLPALPDRERVTGAPGGDFQVSWLWLADAMTHGKTVSSTESRARLMAVVRAHLERLSEEAGAAAPVSSAELSRARTAAAAALARDEFRATVEGPGWWERQMARLQDWILGVFTGMDRLGRRAPWLAPTIEWTCFGLAAAGLLWFVRQSLARQALQISLSEAALLGGRGERDSADWARLAEEHAAAKRWRDAVHCLYWASIALLETRRAWRPNATRTPREYLRLLQSGSQAQLALRDLTRVLERVWYGSAAADEGQYRAARESFRTLESARPERAGENAVQTAATASLASAGGA